ncbi:MAG: hypothetical protein F4X66_11920 [Chloroflexi bacterium]|nr:hypothetical protein [Chloroflexota bacterium]
MRNKTRKNGPSRSGRNAGSSGTGGRTTPGGTSPQHNDEQRAQMQTGLRILARIIARAHLSRQASGAAPAPPPERGVGD